MKKNIFGKLLCLLMAGAMVLGLAACEVNGPVYVPDDGGETTQYTVTFDLNGHGGTAPAAQKVDKGGHATKPATDPTDDNYNFGGWYKEAAATNEFKFAEEKIEKDTTVYAKWTAKQPEPPAEDTSTKLDSNAKIYVVGDSTVSAFNDNYYLPRYGYGTQLYNYLNCEPSQIVNYAVSGRSSLSFLTDSNGNYDSLKSSIKAGDYLIIGFGHNDEKYDDSARFTHPTPDYQTAKTSDGKPGFQYTLYENYVKLAKDKGATPILCTPIVRYNKDGVYTNNSVSHVVSGYGDYAAAIKKLGQDTNTAVVDLTKLTADYYTAHNADAKYFHAFTTYSGDDTAKIPDGMDSTHINMYGAKMIAYWLTSNIPADCSLKANVKTNSTAPTYEVDFPKAVKSDYVKPDYKGFNPANYASYKVDTIGGADWYHTAMGTLGGNNAGNFKFTKDESKYIIVADETKMGSKFAGANDGFGAIFTQIDINKNFEITVKVKVTKNAKNETNDQIAFGIMLRDDIYIDTNDTSILSNFVSASVTAGGKANMSRIDDKANLAYDGSVAYALNTEYEISLTRLGQAVTATVKQGATTKTTTFTDTSFVGVDNNYFYLCLFANRGLTVEFSEVNFAITGDSQGA